MWPVHLAVVFTGRRCWVEQHCDRWYVISALHGLVGPDTVLTPYEFTLKCKPVAVKKPRAERVLGAIAQAFGPVRGLRFSVHAGADYLGFGLVDGLVALGAAVDNPAEGQTTGTG